MEETTVSVDHFLSVCRACLCDCRSDNGFNIHETVISKDVAGDIISKYASVQVSKPYYAMCSVSAISYLDMSQFFSTAKYICFACCLDININRVCIFSSKYKCQLWLLLSNCQYSLLLPQVIVSIYSIPNTTRYFLETTPGQVCHCTRERSGYQIFAIHDYSVT